MSTASSAAAVGPATGGGPLRLSRLSDELLARHAARGSRRAFGVLYERYHQPIYRYCRSIVRSEGDAQDAQECPLAEVVGVDAVFVGHGKALATDLAVCSVSNSPAWRFHKRRRHLIHGLAGRAKSVENHMRRPPPEPPDRCRGPRAQRPSGAGLRASGENQGRRQPA